MTLETIAVFHGQANNTCAWACADGIVSTLSNMGYGVIDCARPSRKSIALKMLEQADLIILSGPEHFYREIKQTYDSSWHKLPARKAIWYSESASRDDRSFDFATINGLADCQYYPAIQDANDFGGQWLPFGVDTTVFRPRAVQKTHSAGFVGNLYAKRAEFLRQANFPINHMQAAQHRHARRSFELLAEAYCSTKIFVNLPALSRLLVTKVTEVMACRTLLITPRIDHSSALANMSQFEDGKHLVYYDADKPEELGDIVRHYTAHEAEANAIADAGWMEVRRSHTLEARLRKILSDVLFDRNAGAVAQARQPNANSRARSVRKLFSLMTHTGRLAYFDASTSTIRHDLAESVPGNLGLEVEGLRARLVVQGDEQPARQIRFLGNGEPWIEPGMTSGSVAFCVGPTLPDCDIEVEADGHIRIRHQDNFLSADSDGCVRNDRHWAGSWEIFRLLDKG